MLRLYCAERRKTGNWNCLRDRTRDLLGVSDRLVVLVQGDGLPVHAVYLVGVLLGEELGLDIFQMLRLNCEERRETGER